MQPKILVIGSKDHNRADCVDWLQPFPNIEEYDSIIIDMQSLTQRIYDKIQTTVHAIKESINTVLNTNREVFCIMDKLITPSPTRSPPGAPVFKPIRVGYVSTNYDWLPIGIDVSCQKTGSSIIMYDTRFAKYLELIDRWNFEIDFSPRTAIEFVATFSYSIQPIAMNKSQKTIAGSVKRTSLDGKVLMGHEKGAIHLLPPPTKVANSQAIELILDLIIGGETKIVQPWRKDVDVPEERELEKQIESKVKGIKGIQRGISQLRSEIQEWDSYRDLLTATGDDLENIVQKALARIDIRTGKTEKGFPADLISKEVAVETTGIKGCVGVSSEKVNQTGRFKESYHKGEKIVLIANTHMDLPPEDRKGKIDFSQEAKKYFESLSVCCLTTVTLFQLWKDVVTGNRDSKIVKAKILKKNGELSLSEFE